MKKSFLNLIMVGSILLGTVPVYGENSYHSNPARESVKAWTMEGNVNYPVTSDSLEWKSFDTHDDMVKACNMPEQLLRTSSTQELVDLMLEYPLLGDLYLYDDVGTGIDVMVSESNILSEIMSRDDGAEQLLAAFENLQLYDNEDLKSTSKDNSMIQDIFLEGVLSREDVLEQLTSEERETLNIKVSKNIEIKEKSDDYEAYRYVFLEQCGKNDIESYAIARDTSATVKTPNGTSVAVTKRTYSEKEASEAYNYTVKNYPNATIISGATTNYNCHSYAWYSQSTSNKYWMNNPGAYMSDGSYKKVGTKPTATGQKVCYTQYPLNNPFIHSGVVYSISGNTIKLTSKWGAGPLVRHNVSYSPYGGTPIYYKR